MPWPNLTQEERDWIKEHGCIHGMFPDESVMFCTKCQPDTSRIFEALDRRRKVLRKEKDDDK